MTQEPNAASLRRFAGEILREAAPLVVREFGHTGPLRFKYGREAITHVDAAVEDRIRGRILERYPSHGVQGEERGNSGDAESPWQWHVDPIDGTLNYALGVPLFSLSLAVMHGPEIVAGAVLDPLRDELFSAGLGEGAYLDEEPMVVSGRESMGEAIVSMQSSRKGLFVRERELLHEIHLESLKTRRLGSIALELAYVAAGRFDLLLAGKKVPQNLYDVAAGLLLVAEAGGRVTDAHGVPFGEGSIELVASNGCLHDEILERIRPYRGRAGS